MTSRNRDAVSPATANAATTAPSGTNPAASLATTTPAATNTASASPGAGNAAPGPKPERTINLAGLRTTTVGPADATMTVVLLHGYAMRPTDLSPFAHSIGIPALFLLPEAPLPSPIGGQAWWGMDLPARDAPLPREPRDQADDYPQGLAAAHHQLGQFLEAVAAEFRPRHLVLGGFSQGGMLALDWVLRGTRAVDALVLLSASRLAVRDWQPHRARLSELPVFVSHGTADRDLAFAAGERLRDFVLESGARVSWVPFEGGHEIPLVVWRGLRKFLAPPC